MDRELSDKVAAATRDAAWDDTTDVIVIGGGLAGHCAALYQALREIGEQQNCEKRVRAYVDHPIEAYQWLRA